MRPLSLLFFFVMSYKKYPQFFRHIYIDLKVHTDIGRYAGDILFFLLHKMFELAVFRFGCLEVGDASGVLALFGSFLFHGIFHRCELNIYRQE